MSEPAFQVGDVVQLRSGGPVMTVEVVREQRVHCLWHTPDGLLQAGTFVVGMLRVATPEMGSFADAQQYVQERMAAFRHRETGT